MTGDVIQLHKLGYCQRCRRPIKRGELVTRMLVRDEPGGPQIELKSHQGVCPSHQTPNPEDPPPPHSVSVAA